MRSTIKVALIAAIPVELVNFFIVGYPAGMHTASRAAQYVSIALQWYVLHLPGIILVDHSRYLREHALPSSAAFLVIGYIDTAILLALIIWAIRLVTNTLRKLSSPLRHAH